MKKILMLALAACVFAGCRAKDDSKTLRFRYWGDTEEIKIISSMIRDFEGRHPGVKVKDERKPAGASQYSEILMTEFAANAAPDVIFAVAEIKDVLAEGHLLENLDPFLAKDPDIKKSDYYPSLISRFSSDGQLLILPRDIAPFACVYYNKDLFKKAGATLPKDSWNWNDLRAASAKIARLKDAKGGPIFGFADDWPMYDAWVLSSGGAMVDNYAKPHRITMDSPAALRGLLFRWDLMNTDHSMPSGGDQQALSGGTMAMFLNGKLGMFYSGSWKIPEFRKIQDFDWDMAMFPKGPEGKRGFASGGSGFGMRKGCKNPDLAWELIRFLAGPEGQARIAPTGLLQPAIKKLADSPAFLNGGKPANKRMLLAAAEIGLQPPASTKWLTIDGDVLGPIMGQIWLPGFQRAEVAAKVKEACDKANQKYFGAAK